MYNADVAQLVEQLIRNEQVTGSIPAIGSTKISESSDSDIFVIQLRPSLLLF